MSLNQDLQNLKTSFAETGQTMPAMFVGHGSPMNAIEDNEFSRAWAEAGSALPRPNAILCVSAHWETLGTQVTAMEKPKTIHDFGGFPRALYQVSYPAPGSPDLAALTQTAVQKVQVQLDQNWGLDHGAWSVLRRMFPAADIPVVQLSLDYSQAPEYHYALGKELLALRRRGILILGSGNIVHNLGMVIFNDDRAYEWALEFDTLMKDLILAGNHDSIIHYEKLGKNAQLSIPTNEHFLPLLYILALQQETEQVHFFAERVNFGSLSMRSIRID